MYSSIQWLCFYTKKNETKRISSQGVYFWKPRGHKNSCLATLSVWQRGPNRTLFGNAITLATLNCLTPRRRPKRAKAPSKAATAATFPRRETAPSTLSLSLQQTRIIRLYVAKINGTETAACFSERILREIGQTLLLAGQRELLCIPPPPWEQSAHSTKICVVFAQAIIRIAALRYKA